MFGQEVRNRALQHVYDLSVRRRRPVPGIASDVRYANRWAERSYRRQPYSGTVALLRTTDPAGGIYPAPLMGWGGLLQGRVDVYDVPGDHLRMLFEPAVDSVAQVLHMRIQAAAREMEGQSSKSQNLPARAGPLL